jgi:hypothetical protein
MDVPVAGEERLEAEMRRVEGGGAGNVAGHDDGVVAGRFHLFSSRLMQVRAQSRYAFLLELLLIETYNLHVSIN